MTLSIEWSSARLEGVKVLFCYHLVTLKSAIRLQLFAARARRLARKATAFRLWTPVLCS
jgi:hypothetical protein